MRGERGAGEVVNIQVDNEEEWAQNADTPDHDKTKKRVRHNYVLRYCFLLPRMP